DAIECRHLAVTLAHALEPSQHRMPCDHLRSPLPVDTSVGRASPPPQSQPSGKADDKRHVTLRGTAGSLRQRRFRPEHLHTSNLMNDTSNLLNQLRIDRRDEPAPTRGRIWMLAAVILLPLLLWAGWWAWSARSAAVTVQTANARA